MSTHSSTPSNHRRSTGRAPRSPSAEFSRCRRYRYTLERRWATRGPTVVFIGLNPSTADERTDDPTVRRCVGFARDWGFAGVVLVNLFALRSTDPALLLTDRDPIGPDNDHWIRSSLRAAAMVVAAWGVRGGLLDRDAAVAAIAGDLHCLGLTKAGHPRHPLYLSACTTAVRFPSDRLIPTA